MFAELVTRQVRHQLGKARAAAADGRAALVAGRNLTADSLQRWLIDEGFTE